MATVLSPGLAAFTSVLLLLGNRKVQVSNDQEEAQSEKKFPLQKPRRKKKTNNKVLIP